MPSTRSRILIVNPDSGMDKTLDFLSLKGLLMPMGEALEDITRPGEDGVSFRDLGFRPTQVQLTSYADLLSFVAVRSEVRKYRAAQGKMVSILDDFGNLWVNHQVLSVELADSRPLVAAVGGLNGASARAMLVARWTVISYDITGD